jgi:hypothetical protein
MNRDAFGNLQGFLCAVDPRRSWSIARGGTKRRYMWIALATVLVVTGQTMVRAQPTPVQPTTFLGESESVSVSATVVPTQVPLFEIALVVRNKTAGPLHMDPSRFALVSDEGQQASPLSSDEAKNLIRNPDQTFWSFFWFGWLGYAANASQQANQMRQVDAKILKAADIEEGASVNGSLYFKPLNPKTTQFTLSIDGLAQPSGEKVTAVRLNGELPRGKPAQGAPAPQRPIVKTYPLSARGSSGPIVIEISTAEFGKDSTSVAVTIKNSSAAEVSILSPVFKATMVDNTGKTYALRFLKTEIGDRVASNGSIQGRLTFDPMPLPPLITSMTLTVPGFQVDDAVYDVKVEMHI